MKYRAYYYPEHMKMISLLQPLGNRLRIAAYFIKRWVNLRCIVKHQYRELYVFPDRFVVCASQLEPFPSTLITETAGIMEEESSSGTSGYFAERTENGTCNISSTTEKKQVTLKNIIKKTKATKDTNYDAATGGGRTGSPCLGPADSDQGNEGKHQILSSPHSETESSSVGQPRYCINTTENSLELPVPEVKNDVNHRQPYEASSQQNPQSSEWLKTQNPSKDLSWICESALPMRKQIQRTSVMQKKRRRHSSEGEMGVCKKADLRDDTFIHKNVQINKSYKGPVEDFEAVPLDPRVLAFQNVSTNKSDALANVTVETIKSKSQKAYCISDQILPSVASSIYNFRTEELFKESKKSTESQPRRLKLQRSKKLP
ncbi:protein SLX4IP isoform X2 [Ascaphus truei]|uniref:protein SLX4IP isoform X2 n=1 Tax=Ascaphus truei TaxID=8439 RepID=UPI003F59A6C5